MTRRPSGRRPSKSLIDRARDASDRVLENAHIAEKCLFCAKRVEVIYGNGRDIKHIPLCDRHHLEMSAELDAKDRL
jgi:hypothetical protein